MAGSLAYTASILAVGSELLGTARLDTNSLFLTERLEELGFRVVRKACVGDVWPDLLTELRAALSSAPLLVVTGGLGPTEDDRTKEAVAVLFDRRLVRDEAILGGIRERFDRRGVPMAKVNEKQADVIEGARVLANPRGTAPGYVVEGDAGMVLLLPGVPVEMKAMWEQAASILARGRDPRVGRHRRTLKVAGMPESAVEQAVLPVYAAHPTVPVTILAHAGEVQLQFAVAGTAGEAGKVLDALEGDFRKVLGDEVFGRDDETLEGVVGLLLREAGQTIALAESCTGGTLSGRITEVAGSSVYFLGTAVSYANSVKREFLGVRQATLDEHGAVSEETAREMAHGVRLRFGATIGVSVTGIAGPGGGSEAKPVGTVHIALDAEDGTRLHRRFGLPGDRAMVRRWATAVALSMLRRYLLSGPGRPAVREERA